MRTPEITLADHSEPYSIQFMLGDKPVITIHSDGRTEIDPMLTTDEAARVFWERVREVAPNFFLASGKGE